MDLKRRNFIKLTLATSLGLYIEGCSNAFSRSTDQSTLLESLRKSLSGRLLLPGNPGYIELCYANNGRYKFDLPIAVAECQTINDIATCIIWARNNNFSFAPRSGGHNFAGYSATDGLLISLLKMKSINFNNNTGIITVGPGIQNRDLVNFLRGKNWIFPSGTCPAVGVSGLTLGGGIGYNSRWAGLVIDNLLSSTVVTATGAVINISATENPDLFWASKGSAGRNFGINSSFTFQLKPVPRNFVLVFGFEFKGLDNVIAGANAWNQVMQYAPNILSGVFLTNSSETTQVRTLLFGQYIGSMADGLDLLAPVLAANPEDQYIEMLSWWDAQAFLTDEEISTYNSYVSKSRFINQPLTEENITAIFTQLALFPNTNKERFGSVSILSWLGGVTNTIAPTATAFVHRNSNGIVRFTGNWPYNGTTDVPSDISNWMEQMWLLTASFLSSSVYQNFPDPALVDWKRAYYGENLNRLISVKRQYDPENIFNFPQSIPLVYF